jgi:sulfide:quinone oxidoreductase
MAGDVETSTVRVVHNRRHRVIVAGGGVAAMEGALALRALGGDHVSLALLTPGAELLYRPVTVAEAFGRGQAHTFKIDEILLDQGVERIRDSLALVDAPERTLLTGSGERLDYDSLLIATGARQLATLPGALTFGGRDDVPAMRELVDELTSGAARSVAFTLGSAQDWPVPLYELALLTAAHLREHGSRARVTLVTPEERPLSLFGPAADEAILPMLTSLGIVLRGSSRPAYVRRGELVLAGGGGVAADRVVTLPGLAGPRIPGLPADEHGFIPVDAHGRVRGAPDVLAAGDVTTFPLKQGGLAAQQADAAAAQIAHDAGAPVTPDRFSPVLRGLLITAGAPVYLRAEPQRLDRRSSVAIDDRRPGGGIRGPSGASIASDQALWWPPAKIAGRYLAPHLATARPLTLATQSLEDRRPVPGPGLGADEFADAVELALLLADGDAGWGDYAAALASLDAAEALAGALPPEYEAKRTLWLREWRAEAGG